MQHPQRTGLFATLAVLLALQAGAGPAAAQAPRFTLATDESCSPDTGLVSLTVDPYGTFGSASDSGGDALYDPPQQEWPQQGTIFESMPFLCTTRGGASTGTWLKGGEAGLGAAQTAQEGNRVTSTFEFHGIEVHQTQELVCNVLTQCYEFTNTGADEVQVLEVTQYIDGDLYFVGGFTNDYGSTSPVVPRVLYEHDQITDVSTESASISLSGTDPADSFLTGWELGQYSESRGRISNTSQGCPTLLNGIVDDGHQSTDLNGDWVTDSGYDVTLSLRFDVGPLRAGESSARPLCLDIRWGTGPADDLDRDDIPAAQDNCPSVQNFGQEDRDADGLGDRCDPCPLEAVDDTDRDGVCPAEDNCPLVANLDQLDQDADGQGDACDPCPLNAGAQGDPDGDGVCLAWDNCPEAANADQADQDGDAVGDVCDNCPALPNHDQVAPAEVCDGKDNDCDGLVDDVPGIGEVCELTMPSGECLLGRRACLGTELLCIYAGGEACPAEGEGEGQEGEGEGQGQEGEGEGEGDSEGEGQGQGGEGEGEGEGQDDQDRVPEATHDQGCRVVPADRGLRASGWALLLVAMAIWLPRRTRRSPRLG